MEPMEAVRLARALLERVTPLKADCGRVCGAACCQCDEDGQGGMLLFPGEERLYDPLPDGFQVTESTELGTRRLLLTCAGRCDRETRPLSCRLFPLLPTENGVVMDRRGWAVCPLMEHGKRGLNPAFVDAVSEAGRVLYACPEHAAFLASIHAYNRSLGDI